MTDSYPALIELIGRLEGKDRKTCELALYCLNKADKREAKLRDELASERERCAKVALDTYSDKDRLKYTHDTYTSGFSDCKLKIHRAIMGYSND